MLWLLLTRTCLQSQKCTVKIALFISAVEISYDKCKYHVEFTTWPKLGWPDIYSGFENGILFYAYMGLINDDKCTDWDDVSRNVLSDSFWYVEKIIHCQALKTSS